MESYRRIPRRIKCPGSWCTAGGSGKVQRNTVHNWYRERASLVVPSSPPRPRANDAAVSSVSITRQWRSQGTPTVHSTSNSNVPEVARCLDSQQVVTERFVLEKHNCKVLDPVARYATPHRPCFCCPAVSSLWLRKHHRGCFVTKGSRILMLTCRRDRHTCMNRKKNSPEVAIHMIETVGVCLD